MRLAEAFASSESVVAVMRASDGVFLDVNAAFERSTGWRRDQVIGRIPNDFGLWADASTARSTSRPPRASTAACPAAASWT
jgi:PAS domain S-box-containing protein